MNFIILIILHFSLGWSFSGLYLILVKSLDDNARAAIEPVSIAHLLRLDSGEVCLELIVDLELDLALDLELIVLLHVV